MKLHRGLQRTVIIGDEPIENASFDVNGEEHKNYYGGVLVAESVPTECLRDEIIRRWNLVEDLKRTYKIKLQNMENQKQLMDEIWEPINHVHGLYEISNFGRVRSIDKYISHWRGGLRKVKGCIIKPQISKWGYYTVDLRDKSKHKRVKTSRLVAIAFIHNSDNKTQVNHKNGIKTDDNVSNLEWCTPSENMIHAYNVLKIKSNKPFLNKKGALHWKSKKISQHNLNGDFIQEFNGIMEAERYTGINHSNIIRVLHGNGIRAGQFKWKFI